MTNFKIVPVEPTEEMLRVACDEEQRPLPMWTRMKAIYTATLDEAPVINIVATKNEQGQIVSVTLQDGDHRILEVIAEADVQGETVGYIRKSALEIIKSDELGVRANIIKEPRYQDCVALYTAPQPAEQQPDVSAIPSDLLDKAIRAVKDLHWQKAYNSVQDGDAERAEELESLAKALAAHRKGGES